MEDRARAYARIRYSLAIADIFYTLLLLLILQFSGINLKLKYMFSGAMIPEVVTVAIYACALFVGYSILNLGFDIYRSYAIEKKFSLSNQKLSAWFLDYLKSNVLGLVFFVLLIECFYFLIRNYPHSWWWMCAILWIFLSVVIARIFPVVIIPLFFKYKRIGDEGLRSSILALADKMKVRILDVFEIDFSKKSLKANAAFVGLGRSKRVLLTDTLLGGKFQHKEIEMILAHEFAHYRFRHILKMVFMSSCIIFLIFYIFSMLDGKLFVARDIADLGGWIFLFMLFELIITPAINFIHRIMERNADREAIKTIKDKAAFISMMEKLAAQNLSERKPPLWVKIMFYDHPTIEERVEFAKNMEA